VFRQKIPFGPIGPGYSVASNRLGKRGLGVLEKADTLEALAEKLDIDAKGLAETVEKNNVYAQSGTDPEFHRGDSFYDRYYGDANTSPNPCIAPISTGPFYAIPIYPGDIGTKGGMLTNTHGQVLNPQGNPIPGLYAVGNCAASVMGSKYPGAGATLGPAMTFGYLAGLKLAQIKPHSQGEQQTEPQSSQATVA